MNGTNAFINNTVTMTAFDDFFSMYGGLIIENRYVSCNHGPGNYSTEIRLYMTSAHGGAILCGNCTLKINEYSTFKSNTAEYGTGGAV